MAYCLEDEHDDFYMYVRLHNYRVGVESIFTSSHIQVWGKLLPWHLYLPGSNTYLVDQRFCTWCQTSSLVSYQVALHLSKTEHKRVNFYVKYVIKHNV